MFKKEKKNIENNSQSSFDFASYYNSSNNGQMGNDNNNSFNNTYNANNQNGSSSNFNQYYQNAGNPQILSNDIDKKPPEDKKKFIKIGIIALVSLVIVIAIVISVGLFLTKQYISLDEEKITLGINNKKKITYQLVDSKTPIEIVFKSSNEEIVTVDEEGMITTHKEGDANITLNYKRNGLNKKVICKVKVVQGDYPSCTLSLKNNVVQAVVSNATSYGFNNDFNQKKDYTLEIPKTQNEAEEKTFNIEFEAKDDNGIIGFCTVNVKRKCTCTYVGSDGTCYKKIARQFPIYSNYGRYGQNYCKTAHYQDTEYCYWYSNEGVDCTFTEN